MVAAAQESILVETRLVERKVMRVPSPLRCQERFLVGDPCQSGKIRLPEMNA
jgi:hypothetical protein